MRIVVIIRDSVAIKKIWIFFALKQLGKLRSSKRWKRTHDPAYDSLKMAW